MKTEKSFFFRSRYSKEEMDEFVEHIKTHGKAKWYNQHETFYGCGLFQAFIEDLDERGINTRQEVVHSNTNWGFEDEVIFTLK